MRSNRTLERHFCSSTLTAFPGKEKCQSACLPLCVAPQCRSQNQPLYSETAHISQRTVLVGPRRLRRPYPEEFMLK
jgi:hypothetical protein